MSQDPAIEAGAVHPVPLDHPAPGSDPRSWRGPALTTAVVFALNALVLATWISRIPATRDRLDLDPRGVGVTLLMMGLGALAAMPFMGRLVARVGSRPVIVGAATVVGGCLVALSVTPNAVATGAVLFVLGAANGGWDVSMNIQGSFVDRNAGRDYMPRYHASWSVGLAVGAGLGALLASLGVGLTLHFAVAAAVGSGGAIVVVLRRFLDDREAPTGAAAGPDDATDEAGVRAARPPLWSRRLVLVGVITLCACLLEGAAADWVALYLTDERAATASLAALGYGIWAAAMALSRFSGTSVIDRVGRAPAIRIAGVVVLAGVVATLVAPGVYGALAGVVLWGAGVALVFPSAMSAGGETPGRAAEGIAVVATIGYSGFLVGPPLIGVLANAVGLGRALWVLPVLAVGIVVLAPVVRARAVRS